jgi:phosphate transport system permease protein
MLYSGSPFIQAQSIFTAGLVMGVMLIPVVSSLVRRHHHRGAASDARRLARARRDALRNDQAVILPAALPGIVGAVLLTASRAIGETMIVVLAAGVAANLTANPFEAMTTITVKIVNQLTGDLEFNSPQTLVAFALGITLFFVTLAMNIVALAIVRKYREQYE